MPERGGPYNFGAEEAQKTLDAILAPWNASLSALTGQEFANGSDWQRWFNKNKSRNWDRDR